MQRVEIENTIERIRRDKWRYDGGEPEYFARKRHAIESLARELQARVARPVTIESPANLQNYYRLEICLTPRITHKHAAVEFEHVEACGEAIYLTLTFSVLMPVMEVGWRLLRAGNMGG